MTKKDLSGRMGVTYKTISKWEDGYWTPLPGSEKFDLLGQHLQKPPAFFSERKTPPVESGATTEASSPVSAISSQKSQTSFSRVAKRPTPNEDISTDIGRLREEWEQGQINKHDCLQAIRQLEQRLRRL